MGPRLRRLGDRGAPARGDPGARRRLRDRRGGHRPRGQPHLRGAHRRARHPALRAVVRSGPLQPGQLRAGGGGRQLPGRRLLGRGRGGGAGGPRAAAPRRRRRSAGHADLSRARTGRHRGHCAEHRRDHRRGRLPRRGAGRADLVHRGHGRRLRDEAEPRPRRRLGTRPPACAVPGVPGAAAFRCAGIRGVRRLPRECRADAVLHQPHRRARQRRAADYLRRRHLAPVRLRRRARRRLHPHRSPGDLRGRLLGRLAGAGRRGRARAVERVVRRAQRRRPGADVRGVLRRTRGAGRGAT